VAAAINFCTLALLNKHLFSLPFENMSAINYSEKQVRDFRKRSGFQTQPAGNGAQKGRRLDPEMEDSLTATVSDV
jgi:hypothetical protein